MEKSSDPAVLNSYGITNTSEYYFAGEINAPGIETYDINVNGYQTFEMKLKIFGGKDIILKAYNEKDALIHSQELTPNEVSSIKFNTLNAKNIKIKIDGGGGSGDIYLRDLEAIIWDIFLSNKN